MRELFTDQELAREFPMTRRFLYFNTAGTGVMPECGLSAIENFLRRYRETDLAHDAETFAAIDRLRGDLAEIIGGEKSGIALVPNTSFGINIVAAGFQWQSGDRILIGTREFPANSYPWLNLARRGVEVDWIPMRTGELTPEMVERAITPRTRLLAISSVQFSDGYRADLVAICALCRAKGIFTFIDGIQSAGAIRVDAQSLGLDAFAAGGQKHLLSPYGTGFLYISPQAMELVEPAYDGWLSHFSTPEDFLDMLRHDMPRSSTARRYEVGSLPWSALWGMAGSVGLLAEIGIERIEQHNLELAERFEELVREIHLADLPERQKSAKSHVVSVGVPNPEEVHRRLKAAGVICSNREKRLRFSFHIYNTLDQVEAGAKALERALAQ